MCMCTGVLDCLWYVCEYVSLIVLLFITNVKHVVNYTQVSVVIVLSSSFQVPRNRYWGLHPPPAPLEDVVDDGLMAIQRAIFLRKAGVDTAVDDDFLLNPPTRADLLELGIKNIIRWL